MQITPKLDERDSRAHEIRRIGASAGVVLPKLGDRFRTSSFDMTQ